MYHGLLGGGAPHLERHQFVEQLEHLARSGRSVGPLHQRPQIALTFDDGYRDLLEVAVPLLEARHWKATVFLTCDGLNQLQPQHMAPKPLLDWEAARQLVKLGWEVGCHTWSHRDLTQIPRQDWHREVVESREHLQQQLGVPVESFAPPLGRFPEGLMPLLTPNYQRAVGTRLGRCQNNTNPYELPRIEMWYYRDPHQWSKFLQGQGESYLRWRRWLRALRYRLWGGSP